MFFLGVRTALLESEDNECPDCQEKGTSPASLIPNRFLRRSVNNFKNETGYIVPKKQKGKRFLTVFSFLTDSRAGISKLRTFLTGSGRKNVKLRTF